MIDKLEYHEKKNGWLMKNKTLVNWVLLRASNRERRWSALNRGWIRESSFLDRLLPTFSNAHGLKISWTRTKTHIRSVQIDSLPRTRWTLSSLSCLTQLQDFRKEAVLIGWKHSVGHLVTELCRGKLVSSKPVVVGAVSSLTSDFETLERVGR
jgi:hypothetical protein